MGTFNFSVREDNDFTYNYYTLGYNVEYDEEENEYIDYDKEINYIEDLIYKEGEDIYYEYKEKEYNEELTINIKVNKEIGYYEGVLFYITIFIYSYNEFTTYEQINEYLKEEEFNEKQREEITDLIEKKINKINKILLENTTAYKVHNRWCGLSGKIDN